SRRETPPFRLARFSLPVRNEIEKGCFVVTLLAGFESCGGLGCEHFLLRRDDPKMRCADRARQLREEEVIVVVEADIHLHDDERLMQASFDIRIARHEPLEHVAPTAPIAARDHEQELVLALGTLDGFVILLERICFGVVAQIARSAALRGECKHGDRCKAADGISHYGNSASECMNPSSTAYRRARRFASVAFLYIREQVPSPLLFALASEAAPCIRAART